MALLFFSFLLATASLLPNVPYATPAQSTPSETSTSSRISVVGSVYCDTCFHNSFSKYSYFIPGVDVHIQCRLKADSPSTAEIITFSVNRTTDTHGVYRLDIPSVDGIDCVDGPPIQSFCQASLLSSMSSECSTPASRSTTEEISVKSKQSNHCIYSFAALSFRPRAMNDTLCGKRREEMPRTLTSSKFFLPSGIPEMGRPKSQSLRAFPYQPINFPKPPSSSLPFFNPPPLHFSFEPPLFTPTPSLFHPPPPPSFNLGDPRTWIPQIPVLSPPPPPQFNPLDPRTWIPTPPFTSSP